MHNTQKELDRIEALDPYWQKLEWLKIKEDDPALFIKLLELKGKNAS